MRLIDQSCAACAVVIDWEQGGFHEIVWLLPAIFQIKQAVRGTCAIHLCLQLRDFTDFFKSFAPIQMDQLVVAADGERIGHSRRLKQEDVVFNGNHGKATKRTKAIKAARLLNLL